MAPDVALAERSLKIVMQTYKASTEGEIDEAFSQMIQQHPDGLLIGGDAFFNGMRRKLIALSPLHLSSARVCDGRRINELRNEPDKINRQGYMSAAFWRAL